MASAVLFAAFAVEWFASASGSADRSKADHWAFKTAVRSPIPKVANAAWTRNALDNFVLARLEAERLAPSKEADRVTLIRRLSFDLTGLPPTPREVEQFLGDPTPNAYEKLVDRLLNSPRYGERWARHWLDVVHFGESHGYDKDKPRLNAWPYRDYVIRSFNEDKPYSRFVQEQLAGDALFPDDADGVVALGFIAAGPWDYVGHVELPESKTDGLIARYNDRDDMVMNTMSTFLSLTVHCARCHDHKFDPISQEDYYHLQAVFAGVDRANRPYDADTKVAARRRRLTSVRREFESRLEAINKLVADVSSPEIEQLDRGLAELKQQNDALPKPGNDNPDIAARRKKLELEIRLARDKRETAALALLDFQTREEFSNLHKRLGAVFVELESLPSVQLVFGASANFKPEGSFVPSKGPREIHLLKRGDVKRPGLLMEAGALSCLPGLSSHLAVPESNDEGARRAALAKWITDPANMLMRRSIVNRVWQYHFGRGIVDTANDFGHMGSLPTHPELLDWLAYWFLDHGESLKKLHRLIVTSATYRQSSQNNAGFARKDGDNRYLWRMNRERLDAESLRDTLLFLSGKLDLTMGGPSVQQFRFKDDHSPVYDYSQFDVDSPSGCRRSVYRFIVRSVPDPFMECLDAADPSLLTARRSVTLTALQALSTLNDAFVVRQCEHFAERLKTAASTTQEQVRMAFRLALHRPPSKEELLLFSNYASKYGLANACRVLVNSSEFLFVD